MKQLFFRFACKLLLLFYLLPSGRLVGVLGGIAEVGETWLLAAVIAFRVAQNCSQIFID